MKRFGVMMRTHRWAVVAALALLVVAGSAAIYSGAIFNFRTANASNIFTAGVLEHTNDDTGMVTLTADLMKPGDVKTGTVVIENTGNLPGTFSVSGTLDSSLSGADNGWDAQYTGTLDGVLSLEITDETAAVVYNGAPAGFTQALGTWAVGATHTYTFEISWPDAPVSTPVSNFVDDNLYKGASLTMSFEWYEVQ